MNNLFNLDAILQPAASNNPNFELFTAINDALKGLSYHNGGHYYYIPFVWDCVQSGKFTLEQFLEKGGYLHSKSILDSSRNFSDFQFTQSLYSEDYRPDWHLRELQIINSSYSTIVNALKPYIKTIELIQFTTDDLQSEETQIPLLVMQIESGDWLGICFSIQDWFCDSVGNDTGLHSPRFYIQDSTIRKPENQVIISIVRKNVEHCNRNQFLGTESDLFNKFVWEIAENREHLVQNLLISTYQFLIAEEKNNNDRFVSDEYAPVNFFSTSENLDEELQSTEKRKLASNLFCDNLTDIFIYLIGSGNIDIFLIGRTKNEDRIGIYTAATWC